jgi:hypothetical protein
MNLHLDRVLLIKMHRAELVELVITVCIVPTATRGMARVTYLCGR